MKKEICDFWEEHGLDHIIPATGEKYPEGEEVVRTLTNFVRINQTVLEVGCGYGRLCDLFQPALYTGLDINAEAVNKAKSLFPEYSFVHASPGDSFPKADVTLLYTVLLHIHDEDLKSFMSNLCRNTGSLVIAEIMDERWRRDGLPPVFNRNPEEYIIQAGKFDFHLTEYLKIPYKRYDQEPWNIGRDSRITFLKFDRAQQK